MAILPLPEDVVAQIKSSSAIVSLAGVVLELLENALDARAAKIEATIDFGRGACTVEDDGLGIAPLEFREDGGLGKLYYTSKYFSEDACLGRHGTFLASLAAVSLLTITSHHHEHRSHNSVTFHHSKPIERQLPVAARHEVKYDRHGTRVTVRNLFGNMPVRVKQRAVVLEHRTEYDRLWDSLKRDVTGLVLSWQRPVSIRIRDAENKTMFNFTGQTPSTPALLHTAISGHRRPKELQFLLNTLSQAECVSVQDWASWIPVSASTSRISIKGAISLEPAPTKHVQFISLGLRPLSASEHNELYDQINRTFSLSSFGTVDDDGDVDEAEKIRRAKDRRFKTDGYTNRQLKGRKGVDRHPMFHIRICLKDELQAHTFEDAFLDQEANLRAVVEVLQAMITQWLSVHHFRPRKHRSGQAPSDPVSNSATDDDKQAVKMNPRATVAHARSSASETTLQSNSVNPKNRKRKASAIGSSKTNPKDRDSPFHDWSRIKSGRSEVYDSIWAPRKRENLNTPELSLRDSQIGKGLGEDTSPPQEFATFVTEPILPGSLNHPVTPPEHSHQNAAEEQDTNETDRDETLTWTNPTTKETLRLNARTGCVIPEEVSRPHSEPNARGSSNRRHAFSKTLRLPQRAKSDNKTANPWLNGVLQTWDNPIFKPTEKLIQQVSIEEQGLDSGCHSHGPFHRSRVDLNKAFRESPMFAVNKLSKAGLRSAKIIAQLDKKFILVKMPNGAEQPPILDGAADVLVIIDQHAADERIRVELLLAELCEPMSEAQAQYRSQLGHTSKVAFTVLEKPLQFSVSAHERSLFATHAPRFAAWGILFDIPSSRPQSGKASAGERDLPILAVTTLPPSISERCKTDPKLLISFLRTTVWKYAEDPQLASPSETALLPPANGDDPSPLWLRRLSSCPQGLIDLVNSRACRSAIMFNDELSIGACEELVARLSRCVFPFMCAHGRPSMVPLVNLGDERLNHTPGPAQGGSVNEDTEKWKQFIATQQRNTGV